MWLCFAKQIVLHGHPEERTSATHGECFRKLLGQNNVQVQAGEPPPLANKDWQSYQMEYASKIPDASDPAFGVLKLLEVIKGIAKRVDPELISTGLTCDEAYRSMQYLFKHGCFESSALPMLKRLSTYAMFCEDWRTSMSTSL